MTYEYGPAWQARKAKYIHDHTYECERCGQSHNLQLHHMTYDHEEGTERDEDLLLLCPSCHNEAHDDSHLA